MSLDEETIEQLRLSREQVGVLLPVIVDQYGNIISGRHRKVADPKWPEEKIEVKDELDRELKILHYNIQHRVRKEETKERLLRLARLLEKTGVPKADISSQLAKLAPYTDRYIRELLPEEYKRAYELKSKSELVPISEEGKHTEFQPKPEPTSIGETKPSSTTWGQEVKTPSQMLGIMTKEGSEKPSHLITFTCSVCGTPWVYNKKDDSFERARG